MVGRSAERRPLAFRLVAIGSERSAWGAAADSEPFVWAPEAARLDARAFWTGPPLTAALAFWLRELAARYPPSGAPPPPQSAALIVSDRARAGGSDAEAEARLEYVSLDLSSHGVVHATLPAGEAYASDALAPPGLPLLRPCLRLVGDAACMTRAWHVA